MVLPEGLPLHKSRIYPELISLRVKANLTPVRKMAIGRLYIRTNKFEIVLEIENVV
jgi:hypothetical protein